MIPDEGTFNYVTIAGDDCFVNGDLILHGRDKRGGERPCLVGPSPRILVERDVIGIIADERHNATKWKVSFLAGDALARCVRPGDEVHLSRTGCGDFGISVLRDACLVLAVGALREVALGDLAVRWMPRGLSFEDLERDDIDTWLEFAVGDDSIALRGRERGHVGDFDVYVETGWAFGIPGQDDCVAVSRDQPPGIRDAAARSAVLLGRGEWKTIDWDFFGSRRTV